MGLLNTCTELDDLGAGQFRHTGYVKPVAYRDGTLLRRIAINWLDSGISERPHIVTRAPIMVSMGNDGLRRIHPTREIDRYVEVGAPYLWLGGSWQKASLGSPDRQGNLLQWITTNANMYIYMGGHFVKLAILLKGGWAPPGGQFAFPVGLTGLTRNGNQLLADGVPVMQFSKPMVFDYDNLDDRRDMLSQFVQVGGQWYVLFTLPDLTGMSRPLIDPTLTLQPDAAAGQDCFMNVAVPDQDNQTNTQIGAQIQTNIRGLLRFDLSSIPGGAATTSATLSLWRSSSWHNGAATRTWHRILAANAGWTEPASWNYADGSISGLVRWAGDAGGDGGADAGCTQAGTDYAAAVLCSRAVDAEALNAQLDFIMSTSEVDSMIAANQGMIGYANTGWQNKYVWSSDHTTAAYRPKIVINYSAGGPVQAMYQYRLRRA